MTLTTDAKTNDCSAIPNETRDYISHGTSLNSELMQRIENLDAMEISALVSWVLSDESPSEIPVAFNTPIMLSAYKNELISAGNFLAFMAGTLRKAPCADPLTVLAHLFSDRLENHNNGISIIRAVRKRRRQWNDRNIRCYEV